MLSVDTHPRYTTRGPCCSRHRERGRPDICHGALYYSKLFHKVNDFMHIWAKRAPVSVIQTLRRHREPLAIRELARLAAVSPASALRVVQQLEADDQVRTRRVGNKRLVELSDKQIETLPPPPMTPIADVERLRAARIPVKTISGRDLTALGWPMRMRSFAVVPRKWARRLSLDIPYVEFERERPLQWRALRPEDVVVAMLHINPIAARAIYERAKLNRRRLRKRIQEENKLAEAAAVGLDERLRLPRPTRVERIPEDQLQRQLRQNPVRTTA